MECLVCKKQFEGQECPLCGFPVVEFPAEDSKAFAQLKQDAEKVRNHLLEKLHVSLSVYYWKAENDSVVLDERKSIPFGNGTELYGKTVWLEQKFARIPEAKTIRIAVQAEFEPDSWHTASWEDTFTLNNLTELALQQIGLSMDEYFRCTLLLKNDAGQNSQTSPWELFR